MKMTSAVLAGIQTLALAASLSATGAFADTTTTTTATSTTATKLALPKWSDNIVLSYWGNFSGPSIGSPGALSPSVQPDYTLDDTNLVGLDSFITLGYKLNPKFTLGFVNEIQWNITRGQDATLNSPYLALKSSNVIKSGGFALGGDLFRVYLPTRNDLVNAKVDPTTGATIRSIATILRSVQNMTYDVPKSRLQLALYVQERVSIYTSSSIVDANTTDWRFNVSPYANYQITPKVAATLWTDLIDAKHMAGSGFDLTNFKSNAPDIEPGINIDITPKFSLNPYLNLEPTQLTLDTTSFGLIISGKLL